MLYDADIFKMNDKKQVNILVLDTAQFVKQTPILHVANSFVTIAEVVAEVKVILLILKNSTKIYFYIYSL